MLNHLHTRVGICSTLNFYLSLRRHYPDQVYVLVISQWSLVIGPFPDLRLSTQDLVLKQWV